MSEIKPGSVNIRKAALIMDNTLGMPADWVAKRANHTHAAVEKWCTHVDSMGWPVRWSGVTLG